MFSQGFFYFLSEKIDWLRFFFILCLACLLCNLEVISTQQFSHGKRNPTEIMEQMLHVVSSESKNDIDIFQN